jgi:hypothetical protein
VLTGLLQRQLHCQAKERWGQLHVAMVPTVQSLAEQRVVLPCPQVFLYVNEHSAGLREPAALQEFLQQLQVCCKLHLCVERSTE